MRTRHFLAAASAIGLATALAVLLLAGASHPGPNREITVVVPNRDLPVGTRLHAGLLSMKTLPVHADDLPAGVLQALEPAEDKILLVPVRRNELLLQDRLGTGDAGVIHPNAATGRRLVALALRPERAGGWWLDAGDRVDVHLVPRNPSLGLAPILLESLRVAAVLDSKGRPVTGRFPGEEVQQTGMPAGDPAVLSLEVRREEAAILTEALATHDPTVVVVNEPNRPSSDPDDPMSSTDTTSHEGGA